jgi:chromosome segregation ATPase
LLAPEVIMDFRDLARQAALRIPGVRGFYKSSLELTKRAEELTLQNVKLVRSNEELKLQLSILRGDLARAVKEAEELRAALRNTERSLEDLSRDKDMYLDDIRRLERQLKTYGRKR